MSASVQADDGRMVTACDGQMPCGVCEARTRDRLAPPPPQDGTVRARAAWIATWFRNRVMASRSMGYLPDDAHLAGQQLAEQDVPAMLGRIAELEAELAGARQDSTRLDWLERRDVIRPDAADLLCETWTKGTRLRVAIDRAAAAARALDPEGQ